MAINEDSRCNELVENEMIDISKSTITKHFLAALPEPLVTRFACKIV